MFVNRRIENLYFQGKGGANNDILNIRNTAHLYALPPPKNRISIGTELP
jgi:hypothetical protein